MKFLSIKEFFYKLNTIGFILLLMPLLAFTFLYYWPEETLPLVFLNQEVRILFTVVTVVILASLTTVYWYGRNKLKRLNSHIEISAKMDGYYEVFRLKMVLFMISSFILAGCYYLTRNLYFTALFLYLLLTAAAQWPTRASFCRRFDLTDSEREMIMLSQDTLGKKSKRA